MFVLHRDGRSQIVKFDKITSRITRLSYGLTTYCDPVRATLSGLGGAGEAPGRAWQQCANSRSKNVAAAPPPSLQVLVAQKVAAGVYKGVTTTELDELAAETAAALTSSHPDYAVVRSRRRSRPPQPAFPALLKGLEKGPQLC